MEGGFIITSKQADAFSKNESVAMKLRWSKNDKEKIFFGLYRVGGITYVIAEKGDDLSEFIDAGVLYDLRSIEEPRDGASLYMHVKTLQYLRDEEISRCNKLRDTLYQNCKLRIRSCGPEFESLMNRRIYQKCHEMVGKFTDGTYLTTENYLSEKRYVIKLNDCYEDFLDLDRSEIELGQKKLSVLFDGFVMARNVIYVGSSPGNSWLQLMNKYPGVKVFSFDMRPLSGTHDRVKHFLKEVKTFSDVSVEIDKNEKYDLIWDVRGEYIDDKQYDLMVKKEIEILNDFLNDGKEFLVRVNVKIRVKDLERYFLYDGGRFFILPYLIERGKTEMRYVARVAMLGRFSETVCASLRKWVQKIEVSFEREKASKSSTEKELLLKSSTFTYSNFNLFLNSKLMRLDVLDYISVNRIDSDIDINLYSINRNNELRMAEYFERNYPVVCSFFSPDKLSSQEYVLIDSDCLDFTKYSVYDSRLFIRKMIPGLRIIVPKIVGPMVNELLTSESFRLQSSYDLILERHSCQNYVNAKSDAAESVGCVYKKFPEPFSVMDNLISVSGHMIRFAYLCVHNDACFLTYCDKILSNFLEQKCVKSEFITGLKSGEVDWYPYKYTVLKLEKKSNQFWHSLIEWRSGLIALKFLISERFESRINVMIESFERMMNMFILDKKIGHELYQFQLSSGADKLKNLRNFRKIDIDDVPTLIGFFRREMVYDEISEYGMCFLKPYKSKKQNLISLLIVVFKVDVAVRFIYTVLSYTSVVSKIDVYELRNRMSDLFDWRRLIHLSSNLFCGRSLSSDFWTEDDDKHLYEYDLYCLFSYEWGKFNAEWRNEYYFLIRMLLQLHGVAYGRSRYETAPNWRKSFDTNWIYFASLLGLKTTYIDLMCVYDKCVSDDLISLTFRSETLYGSVMAGSVYRTP